MSTVLALVAAGSPVAADTFSVTGTSYTNSATIGALELLDSYELTTASGKKVTYTVNAEAGDCVSVYFGQGHDVSLSSWQYYILYSQPSCAASYSNNFPVDSGDGTEFSVVVANPNTVDASYTITIAIEDQMSASTTLILLLFVIIIVVIVVVVVVLRKRKAAAQPPPPMQPPMTPPPAQPPMPPRP